MTIRIKSLRELGDAAALFKPARGTRKQAPPVPCDIPGGFFQTLWIAAWHPSTLNQHNSSNHWSKRARLKASDRDIIAYAAKQSRLVSSEQPRKVGLHLILGKGQRACDPDAFWKSLLDALVLCGMLRGDTARFCTMGPVCYSRSMGNHWGTIITLEDLLDWECLE